MITKRNVFWIGFIGTIVFFISTYLSVNGLCNYKYFCNRAHDDTLMIFSLTFLPIFLLSLITYKMRDEVYRAWFKFARIWVPLSIFLILISPEYGHSLFPIDKGRVSLTMSVLFLLISLILIVIKYFSSNKKQV